MNESSKDISVRFANGGIAIDENFALDQVEFFAHELELTTHYIDCSKAKSPSAIVRTIAKQLEFPEHFEGKVEDLYDCLTDIVLIERRGVAIVLSYAIEQQLSLDETFNAVNQVFSDVLSFARQHGRILIYIKQGQEPSL